MIEEKVASQEIPDSAEWKSRQAFELNLRIQLRKEYEELFKIWKSEELIKLAQEQELIIREGLDKMVTKAQEDLKPPTQEQIQLLLNKEYVTFTVPIDYVDDAGTDKKEVFTIRELPQSVEEKFYTQFKTAILDKIPQLQAFDQETTDMKFEDKVKGVMSLVGDGFNMMAETVVLILNPSGKKELVTKQWVKDNIGSDRQWSIIEAQIEVNRLRSFFSRVSQSGQQTMMTMRTPNYRELQQLAR